MSFFFFLLNFSIKRGKRGIDWDSLLSDNSRLNSSKCCCSSFFSSSSLKFNSGRWKWWKVKRRWQLRPTAAVSADSGSCGGGGGAGDSGRHCDLVGRKKILPTLLFQVLYSRDCELGSHRRFIHKNLWHSCMKENKPIRSFVVLSLQLVSTSWLQSTLISLCYPV